MKIGFYNPYFDSFGGGERYTLTLASHWSKHHDVSIFWDDSSVLTKSEQRFGIDLSKVKVTPNFFLVDNSISKAIQTSRFDLIFFLSDGSIPFSLATYNILHFQVPFGLVSTTPLHLSRINVIICNSVFTLENLDVQLRKKAAVIYPPTDMIEGLSTDKKSKIILSIGRFTSVHTAKKQKELIDAFISIESTLKGWRLILAGGLLASDTEYFAKLQTRIRGHSIDLFPNISHSEIIRLYKIATIYWHAAGFGESEAQYMEHFGISTVEAMSAGAVPIVYRGGGQVEIVKDDENGFLWNTRDQLCEKTCSLVKDPTRLSVFSKLATQTSKKYTAKVFTDAFDDLLIRLKR